MFFICQKGYENYCIKEVMNIFKNDNKFKSSFTEQNLVEINLYKKGNGIIYFPVNKKNDKIEAIINNKMIFPHNFILNYKEIFYKKISDAVNEITQYFLKTIENRKIEKKYIFKFYTFKDNKKLKKRTQNIYKKVEEIIKKKVSRVYKFKSDIFSDDIEKISYNKNYFKCKGLIVIFKDFNVIYIADEIYWNGQKRMKFDKNSPSRSYLKIEEAFFIMKLFYNIQKPGFNDIVVDIGAAPGGWSYSVAKNKAIVFAIDNGSLKKGSSNNKYIIHIKYDGFKVGKDDIINYLNTYVKKRFLSFISHEIRKNTLNNKNLYKSKINNYIKKIKINFLLCDVIEHPQRVLKLLEKWVKNKWCEYFILNLKFGEYDPFILKKKIFSENFFLNKNCLFFDAKHLFHDREEITIFGKIN